MGDAIRPHTFSPLQVQKNGSTIEGERWHQQPAEVAEEVRSSRTRSVKGMEATGRGQVGHPASPKEHEAPGGKIKSGKSGQKFGHSFFSCNIRTPIQVTTRTTNWPDLLVYPVRGLVCAHLSLQAPWHAMPVDCSVSTGATTPLLSVRSPAPRSTNVLLPSLHRLSAGNRGNGPLKPSIQSDALQTPQTLTQVRHEDDSYRHLSHAQVQCLSAAELGGIFAPTVNAFFVFFCSPTSEEPNDFAKVSLIKPGGTHVSQTRNI